MTLSVGMIAVNQSLESLSNFVLLITLLLMHLSHLHVIVWCGTSMIPVCIPVSNYNYFTPDCTRINLMQSKVPNFSGGAKLHQKTLGKNINLSELQKLHILTKIFSSKFQYISDLELKYGVSVSWKPN